LEAIQPLPQDIAASASNPMVFGSGWKPLEAIQSLAEAIASLEWLPEATGWLPSDAMACASDRMAANRF
jgi:hypothetical protein